MAPKTKRTRSTAGATSSSQAQPNLSGIFQNCFNDPNTEIDLFAQFQKFKTFPIRRDRIVDFEFLSSEKINFRYMQQLRDWKFITFLKIKPQVFATLVRVFYSNARPILNADETETIAIESYFMGKPIVLDTQTIATHLGLQNTGLSEESTVFPNLYPLGTSTSVLDAHDRLLHLMVSWFSRPSGGKWSTIRGIDAFWLHCFQNDIRINLAQIIFSDIVFTVNHRHTNLVKSFSYATVLSHIFFKEQIDCTVDLALPLTDPIDEKSLRKCKFHLVNHDIGTLCKTQELEYNFNTEYRYPLVSIDTLFVLKHLQDSRMVFEYRYSNRVSIPKLQPPGISLKGISKQKTPSPSKYSYVTMDDSSASYIHMVHHLIEECLIFNMSKQECVEALSKHASVKPIITSTVWNELEKENNEFFEAYARHRDLRGTEMEKKKRTQSRLDSVTRENTSKN
ncbi:hypothetical protein GQ457_06G007860 [Hibiscus cannabinus]